MVARQRPEAGVEPVDRLAAGEHAVDDLARGADPDECGGIKPDTRMTTRDREHIVHGQSVATEDNVLAG